MSLLERLKICPGHTLSLLWNVCSLFPVVPEALACAGDGGDRWPSVLLPRPNVFSSDRWFPLLAGLKFSPLSWTNLGGVTTSFSDHQNIVLSFILTTLTICDHWNAVKNWYSTSFLFPPSTSFFPHPSFLLFLLFLARSPTLPSLLQPHWPPGFAVPGTHQAFSCPGPLHLPFILPGTCFIQRHLLHLIESFLMLPSQWNLSWSLCLKILQFPQTHYLLLLGASVTKYHKLCGWRQ